VLDSASAAVATADVYAHGTPNDSKDADDDEETLSEAGTPSNAAASNATAQSDAASGAASDKDSTSCTSSSSDGISKLRQFTTSSGGKQVKGRKGRPRKKARPSGNNSEAET
jgi:hypothetical protein